MTGIRSGCTVAIRAATRFDAPAVTDLLTVAFLESPTGDWLIPDLNIRAGVYRDYFRIHVEHALTVGFIDVTTDRAGAALWFPRMQTPMPDPDDYQQRLAAACGPWLPRFLVLDTIFAQVHPTYRHHYLAFLGVAPDRQRHGIGSALLARHHHNLDQRVLPAYLEASTPASRDLYHRHGYTDLATGPIMLPDDGPPIWPMTRPPQPTTQPANSAA